MGRRQEGNVPTGDSTTKLPWEAPATTALTDAESRADKSDIWTQNGNGPAPVVSPAS